MKPAPLIAIALLVLVGGVAISLLIGDGGAPPRTDDETSIVDEDPAAPGRPDALPPPTASGGAVTTRTLLAEDEEPRDLPSATMLTATIDVSVVDQQSRAAVGGAEIALWSGGPRGPSDMPVPFADYTTKETSDDAGAASLAVPQSGVFSFRVTRAGYAPKTVGPAMPNDRLTVRLVPGHVMEGEVVDAESRQPIEGALVRAAREGEAVEAESDARGRFAVADLEAGHYSLEVLAQGYDVAELAGVPVGTSAAVPLSIELVPGVALSGVVADAVSDAPVDGAVVKVAASRRRDGELATLLEIETTTDADGAYRLEGVSRAGVDLTVEREGYASFRRRLRFDSGTAEESLDVQLTPGISVAGIVLAEDGAAVNKAQVRIGGLSKFDVAQRTVDTGADGRFRFDDVKPGAPFQIVAVSPDPKLAPSITADLVADASASMEGVEIRLKRGALVKGLVVDDEARPVPHARVIVEGVPTLMWQALGQGPIRYADEEGEFLLEGMPEDLLSLSASKGELLSQAASLAPTSGMEHEVRLRLSSGITVRGVVTDLGNNAIDDVLVSAYEQSPELSLPNGRVTGGLAGSKRAKGLIEAVASGNNAGARILGSVTGGKANTTAFRGIARTDEQGRFELTGVAPGSLLAVVLQHEDFATVHRFNVAADATELRFSMEPMLSLRGRVIDKASRRAVTQFVISANPTRTNESIETLEEALAKRSGVTQVFRSADGTFELRGLQPGRWDVNARAEGYKRPEMERVKLSPGYPTEIEIEMLPGAIVEGVVLSPSGAPVVRMPVFLRPSGGTSELAPSGAKPAKPIIRTTDWQGKFRIVEVDAGPYLIGLGKMGKPVAGPLSLNIGEGEEVHREFRLDATAGLRVEVRGAQGFPLENADVTVSGAVSGMSIRRRTDAAGKVSFQPLFPETLSVLVSQGGHLPEKRDVKVEPYDDKIEEFQLEGKQ